MAENRLRTDAFPLLSNFNRFPFSKLKWLGQIQAYVSGFRFSSGFSGGKEWGEAPSEAVSTPHNPLREHFEGNTTGPGIYKWLHYFDAYDRHLSRFVGKEVHILEIGVYSGGSLGMWRSYFGPKSRITGVDVEPACKCYENEYTRIVIGDQEDRAFWRKFWAESPPVDIVIDDGGHMAEQQRVTLEECLPRLRPGGVFICEDIHFHRNRFGFYLDGLAAELDRMEPHELDPSQPGYHSVPTTPFQTRISSIHRYPYLAIIETHQTPMRTLESVRRGSEWQPFLLNESS